MENINGVLILTRKDLNYLEKEKAIEDINYTDIAESFKPICEAKVVLFIDEDECIMKILKSRYVIVR